MPTQPRPKSHPYDTTNVLIAFYSRNGATEALANAIAEGARAAGAEVRLRRAREFVGPTYRPRPRLGRRRRPDERRLRGADRRRRGLGRRHRLWHADAFGAPASELRAYIDGLGGVWFQGKLNGKAGCAFGATSARHGGNESTLLSLYNTFAHLGLIIVPTGYADGAMFKAGTPYGATAVVPPNGAATEDDLAVARFQGRRVTEVAAALKAARPGRLRRRRTRTGGTAHDHTPQIRRPRWRKSRLAGQQVQLLVRRLPRPAPHGLRPAAGDQRGPHRAGHRLPDPPAPRHGDPHLGAGRRVGAPRHEGHQAVVRPGELQRITAGTGISGTPSSTPRPTASAAPAGDPDPAGTARPAAGL